MTNVALFLGTQPQRRSAAAGSLVRPTDYRDLPSALALGCLVWKVASGERPALRIPIPNYGGRPCTGRFIELLRFPLAATRSGYTLLLRDCGTVTFT